MALEKQTVIDKIEVTELGYVQVREATRIVEDGVQLSQSFHRYVVAPGDDHTELDPKVRAICEVVHTPEVIQAYQQAQQQEI